MNDLRGLIAAAAQRLGGGDEARFEAELLLAHVLARPRAWLFAHAESVPDAQQRAQFTRIVDARAQGEPIAYLTGHREFWSMDLAVTPDVLIPRADTELLVELALACIPAHAPCDVVDLGTGSGAIALAIARERPQARIVATDTSEAALAVARGNAQRLGIGNVEFAAGDWFAPLARRRFDVVVSNPPYIEAADAHLGLGDLRYEPPGALISGTDGLDALRVLAAGASTHLLPGGCLLLEHGFDQGEAVRALLDAGGLIDVRSDHDVAGHERVTSARMPR